MTWWDDQDMAELLSDDQLNDVLPKLPDWTAQDAALVRTAVIPARRATSVSSSWTDRGRALRITNGPPPRRPAEAVPGRTYTGNCRG